MVALNLAMEQKKREPNRAEQLASKLADESWIEVAQFASYHCQMEKLHLDPADSPPCWIDDPDAVLAGKNDNGWCYESNEAAQLLKRMLACGVSKYHPDPIEAIKKAEKRR
jgi:hypothetical protein